MKTKVLHGYEIILIPPSIVERFSTTVEDKVNKIEEWSRDFVEFVRDHRSQYPIEIKVVRKYRFLCSYCGWEWELDKDGCPTCCDRAIKDHETQQQCDKGVSQG